MHYDVKHIHLAYLFKLVLTFVLYLLIAAIELFFFIEVLRQFNNVVGAP